MIEDAVIRGMFLARNSDPGFNVSFFDLFLHGVTKGDSWRFDPEVALEVAAANAELAEWGESVGFGVPELPFFEAFADLLRQSDLVQMPVRWPLADGTTPLAFEVPLGFAGRHLVAQLTDEFWGLFADVSVAERARRIAELRANYFRSDIDEALDDALRFHHEGELGRALFCAFKVVLLEPENAAAREVVDDVRRAPPLLPALDCSPWLAAVEATEGWLSAAEATMLGRCVASAPNELARDVVEVGSYKGRSTLAIALPVIELGLPVDVTTIDPHCNYRFGDGTDTHAPLLANLRRHRLDDVRVIRGRSTDVLLEAPVCFAFLDGLHDSASLRADHAWVGPHLVPGGLLAFHDCFEHFPDVLTLVEELICRSHYELCGYVDRLIVLRRN